MTRGHDSLPEPPPAEPGVLRLRIDPDWASTGQVAFRATPGLARALLAECKEQGVEASYGAEFGVDPGELLIVVMAGGGFWAAVSASIKAILERHAQARIRVEHGAKTVEISGVNPTDLAALLASAQRLLETGEPPAPPAAGADPNSQP
jgi:hypothetical protein